jgi:hypothetical protein
MITEANVLAEHIPIFARVADLIGTRFATLRTFGAELEIVSSSGHEVGLHTAQALRVTGAMVTGTDALWLIMNAYFDTGQDRMDPYSNHKSKRSSRSS